MLNGPYVGFARLVVTLEEPAALELVVEAAGVGIGRGVLLGRGPRGDVFRRPDAAERDRREPVRRHGLLNGGRKERVAAVDREVAAERRDGCIGKQPAEIQLREIRLAVQQLAIDHELVRKLVFHVCESVLSSGIGRYVQRLQAAFMTGAAVRDGTALAVARGPEHEGRHVAARIEDLIAAGRRWEIEDSVEIVCEAPDIVDRDVEGIVLGTAGARSRVIDEAAGLVPVIRQNIGIPDRVLPLLLAVEQNVGLLVLADGKAAADGDFVVVVLALLVRADLEIGSKALEVGIEHEVHDAGDRVGAIGGGRAAGHGLDRAQDVFGEQVDVGAPEYGRRDHAAAVQQLQRSVALQAAQIQRAGPRAREEGRGRLCRGRAEELRQLGEPFNEVRGREHGKLCGSDDRDRVRRLHAVRLTQTGPRHDDLFEGPGARGLLLGDGGGVHEDQRECAGKAQRMNG